MTEARPVFATQPLRIARPGSGLDLELPALTLHEREAWALLGPSGAGKTTVLQALLDLSGPDVECCGERWFAGAPVPPAGTPEWRRWLHDDVALVPQDARAALDPLQRLLAQVQAAARCSAADAVAALASLGIEEPAALLGRYPHEVSGGQAQRVLLAIALLRRAKLVVADEPTASLDDARRGELAAALAILREEAGSALLLATHDAAFVRMLGARAASLQGGRLVEGFPPPPRWPSPPPVPACGAPVVLAARGLCVRRGGATLLSDIDLELQAGEVLAVLGPSGAGKTTLALALAGLRPHTAGEVARPGPPGAVQYLFQDAHASLTPGRSIAALLRETARAGVDVPALARGVGLDEAHLARPAARLSGGERRRAALLRSLTVQPRVLILDEPTASLDGVSAVEVMSNVLRLLAEREMACILITHDEDLAAAVAHRVLRLEGGRAC